MRVLAILSCDKSSITSLIKDAGNSDLVWRAMSQQSCSWRKASCDSVKPQVSTSANDQGAGTKLAYLKLELCPLPMETVEINCWKGQSNQTNSSLSRPFLSTSLTIILQLT